MILVTGATGDNGVELIKRLSAIGAPVRGMVHKRRDDRNLGLPGVEFVAADFDEPATIRRALDGVDRAFLWSSFQAAPSPQVSNCASRRWTWGLCTYFRLISPN
jgi:uncharacterized protein YbjT (DUF2867 family)